MEKGVILLQMPEEKPLQPREDDMVAIQYREGTRQNPNGVRERCC
jgi:hypothetical protein